MARTSSSQKMPHVRVGARVRFDFGGIMRRGIVIEDRGHLGRMGQQIVRIRFAISRELGPHETEIPVDWIEVLPPSKPRRQGKKPARRRSRTARVRRW